MAGVTSGGDTVAIVVENVTYKPTIIQHKGEVWPIFANVPALPPHFLGRDEIVADLVRRLCSGNSSAISTAGQAGVGKTTLTIAIARHAEIRAYFKDGVLWASLGPNPDLISTQNSWAAALDIDLTNAIDPNQRSQRISNAIGQRRLLVILDDVWHNLTLANQLRCSLLNVSHLLTSRDESLARSFAGKSATLHLDELSEEPSIRLLKLLAEEAFATDPAAATRLARTLGGLPLAIELVGGYLANPERSTFSDLSQKALTELDDPRRRLQLAQERLGATHSAQQTLEAAITLSLEHLPAKAVATFYALGAFAPKPARFERSAAEAVAECDGATLALLIARNLLEQTEAGNKWLAMHQVASDVARQQMTAEAVTRHREHYLQVVNTDENDWQRIEAIYEQVQWAWLLAPEEASISYMNALSTYQTRQGRLPERIQWSGHALRIAKTNNHMSNVALLLHELGYCYSALGEKAKALHFYDQALPLRRQVGDVAGEATTLNNIGSVYDALGEKAKALQYYQQALPMLRKIGNVDVEATTLNNFGSLYTALGENHKGLEFYDQALLLVQQVGDVGGQATSLNNIGMVYYALGETLIVLQFLEPALPLWRQMGDIGGEATTLNNIGSVYVALGEKAKALAFYDQALPLRRQVGDVWGERVTRFNMAMVFEALGDLAQAEAQLQQVVAIDEAVGHPDLESDRAALVRVCEKLQRIETAAD